MYEKTLRQIIAGLLIFGHLITFCLLVLLWQMGGFLFDEMITVFAIMTPLFAAYTGIAIGYIFRTANSRKRGKKWNTLAVAVALIFPVVFLVCTNGILFAKAFNSMSDFDNVVRSFGVIETGFAGYVGQIVNKLLADKNEA